MEFMVSACLYLILPLMILAFLAFVAEHNKTSWLFRLFFSIAIVAHAFVVGGWAQLGLYTRYVVVLLFVLSAAYSYIKLARRAANSNLMLSHKLVNGIYGFVGGLFCFMLVIALRGKIAPTETMDLAFPFEQGRYVVGEGGDAANINHHYKQASRKYAVDIVKINSLGFSASAMVSLRLEDFEVYGNTVYSPLAGTVVTANDELVDLPPYTRDVTNPAGNLLGIKQGSVTVYLAHLMEGSIKVAIGDKVAQGQPIAQVGNSGDSGIPHLHIHAEKNVTSGEVSGGIAVPITFDGKYLVRNDVITQKN